LDDEGALFDSGFDDTGPFRVSPESGGVSLEAALRDFGPAAIDDLIPRLRAIARRLDAAHRGGVVHGALHPSKVIIFEKRTSVVAGKEARAPYAAPEQLDGYGAAPASDQYALAAIAYEWLFGKPLPARAHRPIDVRSMPGVDRAALTAALTRGLAQDPDDRFPSCGEFCDALAAAVVPELPLLADVEDFSAEETPIAAAPISTPLEDPFLVHEPASVEEPVSMTAEPAINGDPDVDTIDSAPLNADSSAVPSWNPSATAASPRTMQSPRFGAVALFLAVIVGAVFGFAAGYMARPRALQSDVAQTFAGAAGTESEVAPAGKPTREEPQSAQAPKAEAPPARETAETDKAVPPVAPVPPASAGAPASSANGRLLVRSTPPGASVSVDGVARGVTPLALRSIQAGTRTVVIARRGFIPETRRVVITNERPARTLDVRLSAAAAAPAAAPARPAAPSTPASLGKPAATTGELSVDSRPSGASVTINGRASGNTPLVFNDLAPGEYRILIEMPGYREFATTVRVVAGERTRAAASLTALVERIDDIESLQVHAQRRHRGRSEGTARVTTRSSTPLGQ
jgi:hypothetical protein